MTSIVQLLLAIKNVKLVITKCEEREVIKSKTFPFEGQLYFKPRHL